MRESADVAACHERWLQEGTAAARAGESERARALLLRAIEIDERDVRAWYWLGRVVESAREREICLANVLALDPAHTTVQAELAELRRQMAEAEEDSLFSKEAIAGAIPRTAEEQLVSEAALEPLLCPYCGAPTGATDRQCPACDRGLYSRKRKTRGHSIYSLGLVIVWFSLANHIWLALTAFYLFSGISSAADGSPGVGRTLESLGRLLGLEGSGASNLDLPLAPVLLIGGVLFAFSLFVAWGLLRRLRFFYWLTVALILLGFLVAVFRAISLEAIPFLGLGAEAILFLLAIIFAFMAYDEFAWVEHRLAAIVDQDVDSPSALYARGREHAERGMWAKAAVHWSKAVALSPGHPDYRIALASAYMNLGQPEQAVEHVRLVQQIEPHNPQLPDLAARLSEMTQYSTALFQLPLP